MNHLEFRYDLLCTFKDTQIYIHQRLLYKIVKQTGSLATLERLILRSDFTNLNVVKSVLSFVRSMPWKFANFNKWNVLRSKNGQSAMYNDFIGYTSLLL